jgi:hypothetical protein
VPAPEAQRWLPSLNFAQTRPDLQSPSLEHESHSPPELPQLPIGSAIRTNSSSRPRLNRLAALDTVEF